MCVWLRKEVKSSFTPYKKKEGRGAENVLAILKGGNAQQVLK